MSWAGRSLLLSRLLPLRRHGSQLTNVYFRRSNLIGSRGYASKSNNGHGTTKRHLYLALDDHKDGFGVHKLDLSDNGGDDDLNGGATRRLTEPPVLRMTRTTLGDRAQFAALGSSIVAIGTTVFSPMVTDHCGPDNMGGVLIYDTKALTLTVAPHLPRGLCSAGYEAAISVGNMLGSDPPSCSWARGGGSLHCLTTDPPVDHFVDDQVDMDDIFGEKFWGWKPLSDSSPWSWSSYDSPPMVPFLAEYITAHAAMGTSTEHEILVSVRPAKRSVLGATFSFSRASSKWTWHGGWLLPVVGHAHYDSYIWTLSHLDTWVGLHADYDPRVTDGHLCAGNVMYNPWWQVGKDKLFRLDEDAGAGWRHVDAKLG